MRRKNAEVPVACSLAADVARHRIEEWRIFFDRSVTEVRVVDEAHLHLGLDGSPETLMSAVDLAQREKACCAFFEFSIDVQADGYSLVIGVPTEATDVLADFSRLLPEALISGARSRIQPHGS
jgi:hypothetical protein